MAGDWIKMRVALDRDPRVSEIAAHLASNQDFCKWLGDPVRQTVKHAFDHVAPSVTRDVTVASLLRVWGVATERGRRVGDTADLKLKHCSLFTIDEIAGVPGFAAAMLYVGWIKEHKAENAIVFPNFLHENVPAEDRRKQLSRDTSRRYREKIKARHGDVTPSSRVTSQSDTREEKSIYKEPLSISLPNHGDAGLPDDYEPDDLTKKKALDLGLRWQDELDAFRDWVNANGRTYRDFNAAFRQWLRDPHGIRDRKRQNIQRNETPAEAVRRAVAGVTLAAKERE